MYGVELSDNIIVADGSVVTKSFVRNNIIIGGNPAKIIGEWDEFNREYENYATYSRGIKERINKHPELLVRRKNIMKKWENKMNILYIVSRPLEINTSASIRNKAMIQGLLNIGNEVDLVTSEPDKNHFAFDQNLHVKGVCIKYLKLGASQNLAKLGRRFRCLASIKHFMSVLMEKRNIYDNLIGIVKYAKNIDLDIGKYDLIISSSDPKSSHLFVYELLMNQRKEFKGEWIQIWGDPFIDDITLKYKNIKEVKKEEIKLLSDADKIVYVSKLTLEKQKENYEMYANKMMYLPIPYIEERMYEFRNLQSVDSIEIAYCGDYLSNVRNIKPLYDCVNQSSKIHLTVCGMSDEELKSTKQVTVYPRVSTEKVRDIEDKADILVHLSNVEGTQIPGKIYQYSGTNKPILFILDGDKEALLENFSKYNRFLFVENSVACLQQVFEEIIENYNRYEFLPIEEFSSKSIAKKLLDL